MPSLKASHLRAMFRGARILVAPLDWGLGHAARCVPVVQALLERGATPVIGAEKGPLALLREAFPNVAHVRIPGMDVRYARGRSMAWAMAVQFPAMLRQVRTEQRLFDQLQRDLRLDAVISDQRFGLRSASIPSVLITHQVFPFSPFAQRPARRINRMYIERFHRCWVPDLADPPGLAGELSHGSNLPAHACYIGSLSRFQDDPQDVPEATFRVVAVISGPEPQRSMLEQLVLRQLRAIDGPHLLVTGKPGTPEWRSGSVRVVGHMPASALHAALANAELIVGRTGYSTLMDLAAIGRGALLVPTPGQPEQEYLGRLHGPFGIHVIQGQQHVNIASALADPPLRHAPCKAPHALSAAMSDLAQLIAHGHPFHRT